MDETSNEGSPAGGYLLFDTGDVFRRAVKMLQDDFLTVCAIAAVVLVLPEVLTTYLLPPFALPIGGLWSIWGNALGGQLYSSAIALLFNAIMIHRLVPQLWGEVIPIGLVIERLLSRFWPILIGSILSGLAILAGFALLIVPGIILMCGWNLFLPIVIGEKLGVIQSLKRSWELTCGYKWEVFRVIFIPILFVFVTDFLFVYMGTYLFDTLAIPSDVSFIISMIFYSVFMSVIVALIGSTYFELLKVRREIDDFGTVNH